MWASRPTKFYRRLAVGWGTHTPPHDKRNGCDIPFVGADVGALRKHATGMFLAPISAAISCCGAHSFAVLYLPPAAHGSLPAVASIWILKALSYVRRADRVVRPYTLYQRPPCVKGAVTA